MIMIYFVSARRQRSRNKIFTEYCLLTVLLIPPSLALALSKSSNSVRDGVDGVRLHVVELQSAVDILVNLSHDANIVSPDNVETQHDLEYNGQTTPGHHHH